MEDFTQQKLSLRSIFFPRLTDLAEFVEKQATRQNR